MFLQENTEGKQEYSAMQEGRGPKTLWSRETHPECKMQDLVKSGHGANERLLHGS